MIKRAAPKLFQFKIWYERFFLLSTESQQLVIFKNEGGKISAQIPAREISEVTALKDDWGGAERCPFQHSFKLVTKKRTFQLFAPSLKERDLWVSALIKCLGVKRIRCSSESQYEDESDDNELQLRYIRMQQEEVQD